MAGLSFAVYGINYMRHLLNLCMNNRAMDQPDIILSDMNTYEQYEDAVLPMLRVTNTKLADAGFQNQTFKSIPFIWSPHSPSASTCSTPGSSSSSTTPVTSST